MQFSSGSKLMSFWGGNPPQPKLFPEKIGKLFESCPPGRSGLVTPLFTCHMNWTIFPYNWKQEKLMTSLYVWKFDMTILVSLFWLLPKLFHVTWNSRQLSGPLHISLVSNTTIGYWLSLKQYTGLILCLNLVHFHAQKFIWWSVQIFKSFFLAYCIIYFTAISLANTIILTRMMWCFEFIRENWNTLHQYVVASAGTVIYWERFELKCCIKIWFKLKNV